jgi:hypothetical protein
LIGHKKGRLGAGLFRKRNAKAIVSTSQPPDRRVEAVVDTGLSVCSSVRKLPNGASAAGATNWLLPVVVLVLDLARPVLGEHVFETGADRPAVTMAAVEGEHLRHAASVSVSLSAKA